MSTNDTRAAFEAWMQTRPGYPFAGSFSNLMWASWQAATEAAKATGTAGEWVQCKPGSPEFYWKEQAEAARQPAPVVAVKTWRERMFDNAEAGNQIGSPLRFMRQEIADLRAALAATNRSQP